MHHTNKRSAPLKGVLFLALLVWTGQSFHVSKAFCVSQSATSDALETGIPGKLYPQIRQFREGNLYVGKSANNNLWLVMERITQRNIDDWKTYINAQSSSRVVGRISMMVDASGKPVQKGSTSDGSGHFKLVLNETDFRNNELWVAFVSKSEKRPTGIFDMGAYGESSFEKIDHPFAKDVLMTVTVASNPQALLTSHMGISASYEGTKLGRPKGISVDLHSFAAKVMLERNPARKYMINAPVLMMEQILANALPPESMFVGTKEMLKAFQDRQDLTLEAYKQQHPEKIEEIQRKTRKRAEAQQRNMENQLTEALEDSEEMEAFKQDIKKKEFLTWDGKQTLSIDQAKVEKAIQEAIEGNWNRHKTPYGVGGLDGNPNNLTMKGLMETYPPILSSDDGKSFKDKLVIFDKNNPEKPWLTIDSQNRSTYDWMFTQPFKPAGFTHFIAVDLARLATVRELANFPE